MREASGVRVAQIRSRKGTAGRVGSIVKEDIPIARVVRPNDRYLSGKEVRLISEENEQVGIVPVEDARERAEQTGLDLVLVAPKANPPVCRIMDYGKVLYEQSKRQRSERRKQARQKLKEVKFHPNIEEHDYQTKLKRVIDFLEKGYKVKISMFMRGREMAHTDIGMELMQRIREDASEYGGGDPPRRAGRMFSTVLSPHRKD